MSNKSNLIKVVEAFDADLNIASIALEALKSNRKPYETFIEKCRFCSEILNSSFPTYSGFINEVRNQIVNQKKVQKRDIDLLKYIMKCVLSDIDSFTGKIDESKVFAKSQSRQAFEHFEQAERQLENVSSERARKDAVRDYASAMEAIIKLFGGSSDIKDASRHLRDMKYWGKDEIVKDGDAIFNTLHRLYPDLRHGSTEASQMSLEEALYWIDRITAYVNYMVRAKSGLGSKDIGDTLVEH